MKKYRVICVILAVLLTVGTAVLMTGCGDKDKEKTKIYDTVVDKSDNTKAPTQTATQSGTSATQPAGLNGGNTSETWAGQDNSGYSDQDAIDAALGYAGDGAQIIQYYPYSEADGTSGWMVQVLTADGSTVTYYAGYGFCYPIDSEAGDGDDNDDNGDDDDDDDGHGINDAYYANVSEQSAGQIALGQMGGEGWSIISTAQGSYEGVEAWVITMTNEEGQTVRAYVNGDSCYFG